MPTVTVQPAPPDGRATALELAFGHLPPEERQAKAAAALELVARGEVDPDGLLLAQIGDRAVGAVLACPLPGGGAAVWPPFAEPGAPAHAADALAAAASAWLRGRGARLAQALVPPEEADRAAPLTRHGFDHVTTLWYLRHGLELSADLLGAPERLAFRTYDDCDAG